eukprot:c25853_g1_i1.p1 GENE.c25853_g1_i1~~c25853_g1_i1.p1  ORF type:complete len:476 (-),score=113.77 c25853_g1_i1:111-1538(-)
MGGVTCPCFSLAFLEKNKQAMTVGWFVVAVLVALTAAVPQFNHQSKSLIGKEIASAAPRGNLWNMTRVEISQCPNECTGHGTGCLKLTPHAGSSVGVEFRCVCQGDFSGPTCAIAKPRPSPEPRTPCPNACSGKGICRALVCACEPGFEGDDCSSVSREGACGDLSSCSGQGSCVYNETSRTFGCECEQGYGGADCSTALHACGQCRHGTCVFRAGEPVCECKSGFEGQHCDQFSPHTDPCHVINFCSGRGQCTHLPSRIVTCNCIPGFLAPTCGRMTHEAGYAFSGPCHLFSGCSGHGKCDDATSSCVCDNGWTGSDCSESLCSDPHNTNSTNSGVCNKVGVCGALQTTNEHVCTCDTGFSGMWCENRPCPKGCVHGRCDVHAPANVNNTNVVTTPKGQKVTQTTGTCVCENETWSGERCDVSLYEESDKVCCPNDCNSHGVCKACVCSCADGFSGANCEIQSSFHEDPVIVAV